MNYLLSSAQMYAAEKSADERGLPFSSLMLNAGRACARIIERGYAPEGKRVLVISGKGKNGGDGFVIAREIEKCGAIVRVLLACGEPVKGDEKVNYDVAVNSGISITEYDSAGKDALVSLLEDSDIVVDAIFGTGFRGALDERLSLLAEAVNKYGRNVVSIDVPSGVNCDTGEVCGECIKPAVTIAISAFKNAHIMKSVREICGKVIVADIGIDGGDFESVDGMYGFTFSREDVAQILPPRKPDSHKGTYGHALCVCGSYKMPGAAYISASGALRSGAGLVTCAFPDKAYPALAAKLTEALLSPSACDADGFFSYGALPQLEDELKKANALLIGCGTGCTEGVKKLAAGLLESAAVPVVIDADGLNAISGNPEVLRKINAPVIITPHPGEMSRLCGKNIGEVTFNPAETAAAFSDKYGCITVLKGANTVVCAPGKKSYYINTNGNSGLAKGGSGDLLSGIIVSLLAQGTGPFDAACASVFIHGGCADEVAQRTSQRGMLVTDIINYLPVYYSQFV